LGHNDANTERLQAFTKLNRASLNDS
jgi:hypothetical protein